MPYRIAFVLLPEEATNLDGALWHVAAPFDPDSDDTDRELAERLAVPAINQLRQCVHQSVGQISET